jgi:hypothetical protein
MKNKTSADSGLLQFWLPTTSPFGQAIAWIGALIISISLGYSFSKDILRGVQVYPDFIPGYIAFTDYYKSGELRLIIFFSLCFFLTYLLFSVALSFSERKIPWLKKEYFLAQPYESILALGGFLIGTYLIQGFFTSYYLLCGIFVVTAFVYAFRRQNFDLCVLRYTLLPFFAFFLPISLICSARIFIPNINLDGTSLFTISASFSFLTLLLRYVLSKNKLTEYFSWKLVFYLQLPLPLLLLRFYRIDYLSATNYSIGMNNLGQAFIAILILALTVQNLNYIRQHATLGNMKNSKDNIGFYITLPSILALAFYSVFSLPPASTLSVDYFHLGEMTLPWQQIVQLGQKPYAEFVSVQGIMALSISFFNWIFFDNTLATFFLATSFMTACILMLSAFLSCKLIGKGWTLLLLPLLIPFSDRFYLIPPAFLLLANPSLIKIRTFWCIATYFVCLTTLFWNPAAGTALTGGLALIGALQIYLLYKENDHSFAAIFKLGILLIICMSASFLLLPLRGLIDFLIENGSAILPAHGIQYFLNYAPNTSFPQHFDSPLLNRLLFELVRAGGVILGICVLFVPAVFATVTLLKQDHNKNEYISLACLTFSAIIFSLLMIPQSFGRIDPPPHLSRQGNHSMLVLAFFIPFAFALAKRFRLKTCIPVVFIGFSLSIPFTLSNFSLTEIANKTVAKVNVPADYVLVDGAQEGMPLIGRQFVLANQLAEIRNFKETLFDLMTSEKEYFDLTNYSAMHLIMNLEYPSPYPYFLAVNTAIQQRVVERLKLEKPAVIWVAPAFELDFGVASLRAYRVYRWLLLNGYKFISTGAYGFLLSPERFNQLYPQEVNSTQLTDGLVKVFYRPELKNLPIAWGKSFLSLQSLVNERKLAFSSSDASAEYKNAKAIEVSLNQSLIGRDCDYLMIDISVKDARHRKSKASLQWKEQDQEFTPERSFNLNISAGKLILPLASDPRWLLGKPKDFRLIITGSGKKSIWKVESISALSLKGI